MILPRFAPDPAARDCYREIMTRLAVVLLCSACTSLGPMPAVTGVAPLPAGRAAVELQVERRPVTT